MKQYEYDALVKRRDALIAQVRQNAQIIAGMIAGLATPTRGGERPPDSQYSPDFQLQAAHAPGAAATPTHPMAQFGQTLFEPEKLPTTPEGEIDWAQFPTALGRNVMKSPAVVGASIGEFFAKTLPQAAGSVMRAADIQPADEFSGPPVTPRAPGEAVASSTNVMPTKPLDTAFRRDTMTARTAPIDDRPTIGPQSLATTEGTIGPREAGAWESFTSRLSDEDVQQLREAGAGALDFLPPVLLAKVLYGVAGAFDPRPITDAASGMKWAELQKKYPDWAANVEGKFQTGAADVAVLLGAGKVASSVGRKVGAAQARRIAPERPPVEAPPKVATEIEGATFKPEPQPVVGQIPPSPQAPTAGVSKPPQWLRESIEGLVKEAEASGVADKIEALAAQRKTAKEIAHELGLFTKLNGVTIPDIALVRSVRAKRGIPPMDDYAEFENWLKTRRAVPSETPAPGAETLPRSEIVPESRTIAPQLKPSAPSMPEAVKGGERAGMVETIDERVQKFVDYGYTKPTARSRAILDPIVEYSEGHPGPGLLPWSVRLTTDGARLIGRDNQFITRATDLHEAARKYQEVTSQRPAPLAQSESLGQLRERLKDERDALKRQWEVRSGELSKEHFRAKGKTKQDVAARWRNEKEQFEAAEQEIINRQIKEASGHPEWVSLKQSEGEAAKARFAQMAVDEAAQQRSSDAAFMEKVESLGGVDVIRKNLRTQVARARSTETREAAQRHLDQFEEIVTRSAPLSPSEGQIPPKAAVTEGQLQKPNKPRLAETPDDLYAAIVRLSERGKVGPDGRILYPNVSVIGVGDMTYRNGEWHVVHDYGMGIVKATPAELRELHHAIDLDAAQVNLMSRWGGSGNRANVKSKPVEELHSPSGSAFGKLRSRIRKEDQSVVPPSEGQPAAKLAVQEGQIAKPAAAPTGAAQETLIVRGKPLVDEQNVIAQKVYEWAVRQPNKPNRGISDVGDALRFARSSRSREAKALVARYDELTRSITRLEDEVLTPGKTELSGGAGAKSPMERLVITARTDGLVEVADTRGNHIGSYKTAAEAKKWIRDNGYGYIDELTPGKTELAGGLGAISPFRKAQEKYTAAFREARRKRNQQAEQQTPENPAHVGGDIADAPSMILQRGPKDIGASAPLRTPGNLFGATPGQPARYGKTAQAAQRALMLSERDIMVEAGKRGERMEAAIHKIDKKDWGKHGEKAYDHIVDPSRDAELAPASLEGVKEIRKIMAEDKAEIIGIKRDRLRDSIAKVIEREYRKETDTKGKRFKPEGSERQEIAARVEARLKEMVPDDWGVENYLPQMHPGSYQVFAEIAGEKQFVGAARTPMEAIEVAMRHYGDHPELTPDAYHTVTRVFRGGDVLRTSRKNFYRVVNKIADQAERQVSTESVREALRGVLGSREGRQKHAGFLQRREGYEGFTKDLPKVLAAYNQQFVRWKHLSKLVEPIEKAIGRLQAEGRTNTAEAIKNNFSYLWGESPSRLSRLFDKSVQHIPHLRDYVKPMALDRWAGYIKGGSVNLFLKFSPRFHALNRLQTFQTLSPLIKRNVAFYKSAEGKAALERHGVKHLTGGKMLEGGRSYTSPEFREKFRSAAPETFNQELAWATFYKEAIDMGLPDKAAADYAFLRGNVQSQFLPLKTDTPPLLRGPITSTIGQFRRFGIKDLELGYDLLASKNFPGAGKWIGAKLLFGGVRIATKPLTATGGSYITWQAYNYIKEHAKEEAKELGMSDEMAALAGESIADGIAFGLPGMIGLDMSYSFQVADIPYGENVPEKIGNLLLGPVGQTAVGVGSAIADTKGGEPSALKRSVQEVGERIPALRWIDALRALWHKADEGGYEFRDQSGRLKFKGDLKDVIVKAAGGRTTTEGRMQLMLDALTEVATKRDEQIDEIVTKQLDDKGYKAQQDINKWNELWPEFPINNEVINTRRKARKERIDKDRGRRAVEQSGKVFERSEFGRGLER